MSVATRLSQFNTTASDDLTSVGTAQEAYELLCRLYDQQTENIRGAFKEFKEIENFDGLNGFKVRAYYPRLRIEINEEQINRDPEFSHGAFKEEGIYELNMSDPRAYHDLLLQMEKVAVNTAKIKFQVGLSREEIPLHYAMQNLHFNLEKDEGMTREKTIFAKRIFTKRIPEKIADYVSSDEPEDGKRLLLPYNGQRWDQADHQFFYYTNTPFAALQPYVIFSNYDQYVDDLYQYGMAELKTSFNQSATPNEAQVIAVVRTGHAVEIKEGLSPEELEEINKIKKDVERNGVKGAQMPACHLLMSDGLGISAIAQGKDQEQNIGSSLVNTSVGAPSILNLSDLVAPKRSHGWIMAGHAAGITPNIEVGAFVYAEGYFINPIIPNEEGTGFDYSNFRSIAGPPSSEIQRALKRSVDNYAAEKNINSDKIYRRAPVISTGYRMWERFSQTRLKLQDLYAAVLEMETSYLALKAREQSIPFGAFLKVSDMPHYDLPKTSSAVDEFFGDVGPHLGIIIEGIKHLKQEHMDNMHSRKNRAVEGPKAFVFQ